MSSPLEGLRILDLSRVLAGPVCTQILGDLGAEILKIEKPFDGDDTRNWGPPYLKDKDGNDTNESAYYLSANRNKKSITIDISKPEGQKLIHALAAQSDVLIHNFKVGGLDKYGLGFTAMHEKHPHLIYTAISGFGQNGPLASEPGYDLMAQAMGGLMGHTGEPDGEPMKSGVALVDIMTGLYAAIGTLAALNAREKTGLGQMVDVALLDVTLASMTNLAQYFLTSGKAPKRYGNAHSTIVPYQAFEAADGHMVIAVGNDHQFKKFAAALGRPEWGDDARFARNSVRVANRDIIVPLIQDVLLTKPVAVWVSLFQEIDVPSAPVNSINQVFDIPQIQERGMEIEMEHPQSDKPIKLVGSPFHLSETPVSYRLPPPVMGQHTDAALSSLLGLAPEDLARLRADNII
ncbi:MAG: CoA transferase [Micavibrio aeruginosavorus]|uniref:CoA transferase n=1 Tax=Micavibrio aeruginosavorus TaxID=349221 RepID=A0A2W5N2Y0_9BACT|nr:MAG: CoA transferase [Micavibrio aeruginosavorus]